MTGSIQWDFSAQGKTFIDNYSSGGLVVSLDLKTGRSIDLAEDMYRNRYNRYDKHPATGVALKGFQIPLWDKVIDLVKRAAIHYELNYVAWDIAVRESDWFFRTRLSHLSGS